MLGWKAARPRGCEGISSRAASASGRLASWPPRGSSTVLAIRRLCSGRLAYYGPSDVDLGLRYEARTPWTEIDDRQVGVNILTGALEFPGNTPVPAGAVGTNGFSDGLYKTTYGLPNFQPRRVCLEPQALGGKTVIRGAYTISSYLEGTGTNLRLTQNPPFTPAQVEANNVATGTGYSTETDLVRRRRRRAIPLSEPRCWPGPARFSPQSRINGTFQCRRSWPTTPQCRSATLASAQLT